MIARVASAILVGVEARLVEVQVDLSHSGLPGTQTVGLPGTSVRESQERVRIAIRNSGLGGAPARITVNLAPADLPKQGSSLDLAVAAAVLLAEKERRPREGWIVVGELALDGTLRPIPGALPMALAARAAGGTGILLPEANAAEAAAIGGIAVAGARDLAGAYEFLTGERNLDCETGTTYEPEDPSTAGEDLADVRGQPGGRRALEVAAAGGHNIVLIGPPGTGKTMLARRLRTILPPLTQEEAIEITRVASAAGVLPPGSGLARVRPFRAPHHSITPAGLVGGGADLRPGEVSLAHEGVLFLDELPEFARRMLDLLRQPIEDGELTIVRNRHRFTLPSRFLMVAGMNPCPCGYRGSQARPCRCTPHEVHRYMSRISGPLWDRFDLVIDMPAVSVGELAESPEGECSATVRGRVERARALQQARGLERAGLRRHGADPAKAPGPGGVESVRPYDWWDPAGSCGRSGPGAPAGIGADPDCRAGASFDAGVASRSAWEVGWLLNSRLGVKDLPAISSLPADAGQFLRAAAKRLSMSARAVHRVLRVARTISDLEASEDIGLAHVAEALSYRPRFEVL